MKIRSERVRDIARSFTTSPLARAVRNLCSRSVAATPATKGTSHRPPPSRVKFETFEPRVLMAADPVLVTGAIDSPGETDRYTFTPL